jgi:8-oxo-dGTP pyrophosphatase MutT (NUDIX family)
MRIPLPESLHLRMDLIANPVPTRAAATIAVVRDGTHGLEAFLMRRRSALSFAPGMYVFPGGSVHPSDSDEITWVGPPPEQWAQRFSCHAELAKALVVSAVRETFEETGVLLAGPDEHSVLDDTTGLDCLPRSARARGIEFR